MKKILMIVLLVSCSQNLWSYEDIKKETLKGVENLFSMKSNQGLLYSSSQPDEASFELIQKKNIKTVLNLRSPDEIKFNEKDIVEKNNMTYINLPVKPDQINQDLIKKFSSIVGDSKKYPLFIHCSSANRVATMLALHEIITLSKSEKDVIQEAQSYGLTKEVLQKKIKKLSKASK